MKKKCLSLLMVVALLVSILAGCATPEAPATSATATNEAPAEEITEAAAAEDPLKIVYLCNGNLGDKGFYDSAHSGMLMLADTLGAEVKTIEMGQDETSYESYYLDVSEQDWDMIVSGTFSVKELAQNIAIEFPEKNYLIFDVAVDRSLVTTGNIMGLTYYSNQAAFLSGVLAAKMLDTEDAKIDGAERTLGFVGSMDNTGINDFLVGYLEGVKFVDPTIRVLTAYVGSFEDVAKCMEMTTQLYNQGAQIVYAPASQSILGAATAAMNADKYLIACDQDLYSGMVDADPDLAANILSSSLKNVGESICNAITAWDAGEMSLEEDYILGLDSGSVGLAKNENYKAIVPQDIQDMLTETEEKIMFGEIEVSSAYNMTTDEIVALRESLNP